MKDEMMVYGLMVGTTEVSLFIDLNSKIVDGETVDHNEIDRLIAKTERELQNGQQPMHLFNEAGFTVGRVQYIS